MVIKTKGRTIITADATKECQILLGDQEVVRVRSEKSEHIVQVEVLEGITRIIVLDENGTLIHSKTL